jgi:hypothetical protein
MKRGHKARKPKRDSGTRSRVAKGPARDPEHLARVRQERCLFCDRFPPNEAHHVRLGLRTMGVRKSDYLAVPLCSSCHRMLHQGKEEHFWNGAWKAPGPWIASFSEGGRKAIQGLSLRGDG